VIIADFLDAAVVYRRVVSIERSPYKAR